MAFRWLNDRRVVGLAAICMVYGYVGGYIIGCGTGRIMVKQSPTSGPAIADIDSCQEGISGIHSESKQINTEQIEITDVERIGGDKSIRSGGDTVSNPVAWVSVVGLVIIAATYPIGKLIWMILGAARQRVRKQSRQEEPDG